MSFPRFILIGLFCVLVSPPSRADPLEAGMAEVDITPPVGYRLSGYFHERLATGVHDPLLAKAVVFGHGEGRAAMVFCDLIGMSPQVVAEAKRLAQTKTRIGRNQIIIAATHSHTGPLYAGVMRQMLHDRAMAEHGRDPAEQIDYPKLLAERIAEAIEKADAARQPVKLSHGFAEQQGLSFNRRFHMKDGTVRFNPGKLNPDIVRPAGPIDPQVGIVMIRRASDDKPIASLTVFALHLDTVGGTEYSADFPYYLSQSLKAQYGEEFVSLFGLGTCGDINHIDVTHDRRQGGHEEAERIGRTLGETVKAKMATLTPVNEPRLFAETLELKVRLQQVPPQKVDWAMANRERITSGEMPFLARVEAYKILDLQARGGDEMPFPAGFVMLSADCGIITLPGEIFVEHGLAIKKASPFKTTLVIELANDAPGYVPTEKAFTEGSYETVNSRIAPGQAEVAIREILEFVKIVTQNK